MTFVTIMLLLFLPAVGWIILELWREGQVEKAAKTADPEIVRRLSSIIPKVGDTEPLSYFLLNKGEKPAEGSFKICFPANFPINWLANKQMSARFAADRTETDFADIELSENTGSDFELVGIPRITMKSGRIAHRYQPNHWMKKKPEIRELAAQIYARDPEAVLNCVYRSTGHIGSPFQWLQDPPKLRCKECRKKPFPVLQLSGRAIGYDPDTEFYIAACNCTPDTYSSITQSS